MISSAYSMGVDAHDAMQKMYHSEGGRNFSQYANPDFDRRLAVEESTFDIEERISLMQDMQRFINTPEEIANAWTDRDPSPTRPSRASRASRCSGTAGGWIRSTGSKDR